MLLRLGTTKMIAVFLQNSINGFYLRYLYWVSDTSIPDRGIYHNNLIDSSKFFPNS